MVIGLIFILIGALFLISIIAPEFSINFGSSESFRKMVKYERG